MISRLEQLPYNDRLRELGLVSVEKKRFQAHLTVVFQYPKVPYKTGEGHFIWAESERK